MRSNIKKRVLKDPLLSSRYFKTYYPVWMKLIPVFRVYLCNDAGWNLKSSPTGNI